MSPSDLRAAPVRNALRRHRPGSFSIRRAREAAPNGRTDHERDAPGKAPTRALGGARRAEGR